MDDILEYKEENKMMDFIKEALKSNVDVHYKPLSQNKYLQTLRNLVNTILSSLECITDHLDILSQGYYELVFFY
jgi:hypothetical protein